MLRSKITAFWQSKDTRKLINQIKFNNRISKVFNAEAC